MKFYRVSCVPDIGALVIADNEETAKEKYLKQFPSHKNKPIYIRDVTEQMLVTNVWSYKRG